jgi:hypothetical protein
MREARRRMLKAPAKIFEPARLRPPRILWWRIPAAGAGGMSRNVRTSLRIWAKWFLYRAKWAYTPGWNSRAMFAARLNVRRV